jgi:rod shape-determining protein MreD
MKRYARYVFVLIILLVVQGTLIPFISLAGVTPDVLLILAVIIALREGQIPGTIAGFVIGLIGDLAIGDFLGPGALTKTLAGFTAGYFYNETNPLQVLSTHMFILVIAVAAFVHNVIYFAFLLQGFPVSAVEIIVKFMIGSTVYTVIVSLVLFFYYNSRPRTIHT